MWNYYESRSIAALWNHELPVWQSRCVDGIESQAMDFLKVAPSGTWSWHVTCDPWLPMCFFWSYVFSKVFFSQHHSPSRLSISYTSICIPFLFNWIWIQITIDAMSFNNFICMQLNFHKINSFFPSVWLLLVVCSNMEPKLIIDSVQKKVQKLKGSPYIMLHFYYCSFHLGSSLLCITSSLYIGP